MSPKVTVIIPVFGAEKFIEKCARSLFEQTLDDVEYIFVDDFSSDNSIKILKTTLEQYPLRKDNVKIIHHTSNLGVANARQTGLENSIGNYFIHCDPDDWVESDWLETLYNEAIRTCCDMVSCDFYYETSSNSEIHSARPTNLESKDLRIGMTKDICGAGWNKLIKADIIKNNDIAYLNGINYQEDLLFNYKTLCYCKSISHIDKPLYHYSKSNETSITSNLKLEHIKPKFIVKYEIFKAEKDKNIWNKIKYHICKDYEIQELWICKEVSNSEFKKLFQPFINTLWNRKNVKFKWKLLVFFMFLGFGGIIRKRILSCKR